MDKVLHIETISQLHGMLTGNYIKHPLATVIDMSVFVVPAEYSNVRISNSFYAISFKSRISDGESFGRKYCDFEEGVLIATAPGQVFIIPEAIEKGDYKGWAIFFHPDLVRDTGFMKRISNLDFFSYNFNEALHLSGKEQSILQAIIDQIIDECGEAGQDYNFEILSSSIGLLLTFISRFYGRQFATRKIINNDIVDRFNALIAHHYEADREVQKQLPTVNYLAEKLNLSPGYLSDLLKKNTGKTALEIIHYQLIERAKTLLLAGENTVAEISFKLGFEYPTYFGRIFKRKTGKTPLEFRKLIKT